MKAFEYLYHSRSFEVCVTQVGAPLLSFFKQCPKWGMMAAMGKKSMSPEAQGGSSRKDAQVCVSGRLAL